jgi:hypothetical protein
VGRRYNDVFLLVDMFCEGILVHFIGVVKEALDGQNSPWRIREVFEVVRSCRGARRITVSSFLSASSGEIGL